MADICLYRDMKLPEIESYLGRYLGSVTNGKHLINNKYIVVTQNGFIKEILYYLTRQVLTEKTNGNKKSK